MITEDLADVVRQLNAMTNLDALSTVMFLAEEAAKDARLPVLPAIPESKAIALFGPDDLPIEEFVEHAAATGVHRLYLHTDRVGADELPPEDSDLAVLKAVKRFLGASAEVEVAFAQDGVVHVWRDSAPWAELLEELTEAPTPRAFGRGDFIRDDVLPDSEIEQLAQEVAQLPQVRTARPGLRAGEVSHPRLAELAGSEVAGLSYSAGRILRDARDIINKDRSELQERLFSQLDDLAVLVVADEEFRKAQRAPGRKRAVKDFLQVKYGFLFADELVTELAGRAQRHLKVPAVPGLFDGTVVAGPTKVEA